MRRVLEFKAMVRSSDRIFAVKCLARKHRFSPMRDCRTTNHEEILRVGQKGEAVFETFCCGMTHARLLEIIDYPGPSCDGRLVVPVDPNMPMKDAGCQGCRHMNIEIKSASSAHCTGTAGTSGVGVRGKVSVVFNARFFCCSMVWVFVVEFSGRDNRLVAIHYLSPEVVKACLMDCVWDMKEGGKKIVVEIPRSLLSTVPMPLP